MPPGRHRSTTISSRIRRIAVIVLPALVVAAVPIGVATWPSDDGDLTATATPSALPETERGDSASRSTARAPLVDSWERSPTPEPTSEPEPTLESTPTQESTPESTGEEETPTPEPTVIGSRFVTVDLNVRAEPSENSELVTVLPPGAEVAITDIADGSWRQVIHDETPVWVSSDYLSESEPAEDEPDASDDGGTGGISTAECPSGSSVEEGLTPNAIAVHRAVCAQFPQVTSYGGVGGGGYHSEGRAVDVMVSDSSLGDAIAEWVRENHAELGVTEVIWAQRIWTVQRSSEGWRAMEDRGSDSANHYDHVHVSVDGN